MMRMSSPKRELIKRIILFVVYKKKYGGCSLKKAKSGSVLIAVENSDSIELDEPRKE